MTTLDKVPIEHSPVHLLLIARTKFGKSSYAARAAEAGYRLLYIDSDNGISALRNVLSNNIEAMKRVNYIHTERQFVLLRSLLNSSTLNPMRWVLTRDTEFVRMGDYNESDIVVEINIDKAPRTLILDIDSWTSLAADAMELGAAAKKTDVIEMGDKQGVYGEANTRLTWVANKLQAIHCNCIVQAHDTVYEMYEKPTGYTQGQLKQKDMILRDVVQIPVSSSRPHGYSLGKQFNFIGWLDINHLGELFIDFTRSSNRVGGGPPNKRVKVNELYFERLVDPKDGIVPPDPGTDGWLRYVPALQLKQELESLTIGAGKAKPAGLQAPQPAQAIAPTPVTLAPKLLPASPLARLKLSTLKKG
jgi:hypothetical protein